MNVKLYFEELNDWINPFSENYKNAVKGFDELKAWEKAIIVAVSVFCGFAFIVGGIAAFRSMVSWLHPGENSKADKVNDAVKNMHFFSSSHTAEQPTDPINASPDQMSLNIAEDLPHPAEIPTEFDHMSELPDEILLDIATCLDNRSLLNIGLVSSRLFSVSKDAWKGAVEQRLGPTVAAELKQSRASWRDLMVDLNRPFQRSSSTLRFAGFSFSCQDKPELRVVYDNAGKNDTEALKKALIDIKNAGKSNELNSRWFGNNTPLEIAAMKGNVENARLLIEYGARDAIYEQGYGRSKDGITGMSALFYAAKYGHVEMVKFLLDNGARPNLLLESRGYDEPFLPTLILERKCDNSNFLECLLLLINAWKAEEGHDTVCKNKYATDAFRFAITGGGANTANLFFALGFKINLHDHFDDQHINNEVLCAINHKNLEMIKLLHMRKLVDLRSIRRESGETLLHMAFAADADEILQYLINEVKIPVDVINANGETYDVSGKKELEQNLRSTAAKGLTFCWGLDPLDECLKYNVDLNVPINDKGQTLLHLAVKWILLSLGNGENGAINLLLENGANPYIEDSNGLTPLKMAQEVISKERERDEDIDPNDINMLRAESLIKKMHNKTHS